MVLRFFEKFNSILMQKGGKHYTHMLAHTQCHFPYKTQMSVVTVPLYVISIYTCSQ